MGSEKKLGYFKFIMNKYSSPMNEQDLEFVTAYRQRGRDYDFKHYLFALKVWNCLNEPIDDMMIEQIFSSYPYKDTEYDIDGVIEELISHRHH